ncbi:hypothetical protein [Alteromonas aestuariivivens]|uniref:hypothetical protein n=1 Tax=Alteromonas aestuariivivens TaxID=1938339 RepID=UPI0026AA9607
MIWAQRLKRVFNIDITLCESCTKHSVKIIACISEPVVIKKIFDHLDKIASPITSPLPSLRAPRMDTFDDSQTIQRDFDWGA